MSLYKNLYKEDLPPRAKTLYMYLTDRTDKNGECWPAIKTISRDTSMSVSTVKRALADLISSGLIEKQNAFRDNGGQTSNRYFLKWVLENITKYTKGVVRPFRCLPPSRFPTAKNVTL